MPGNILTYSDWNLKAYQAIYLLTVPGFESRPGNILSNSNWNFKASPAIYLLMRIAHCLFLQQKVSFYYNDVCFVLPGYVFVFYPAWFVYYVLRCCLLYHAPARVLKTTPGIKKDGSKGTGAARSRRQRGRPLLRAEGGGVAFCSGTLCRPGGRHCDGTLRCLCDLCISFTVLPILEFT